MKKKAHKTRRQQLAEKTAIAKERVDAANALSDPLNPSLRSYKAPDGSEINVKCSRVGDLQPETLVWIFDLMERNMKVMYEQTRWGWNAQRKQKELTEPAAWYLVASDADDKLIGFSHFRFDVDYGVEVLYCYELQIEPTARRKKLGRFMMAALESMALENLMQKVILTVFKRNFTAVPFFHTLGYTFNYLPFTKILLFYVFVFDPGTTRILSRVFEDASCVCSQPKVRYSENLNFSILYKNLRKIHCVKGAKNY